MVGESQEIRIISVNKEEIRMGSDKKECWVVPFKLSLIPDESWQRRFYEIQQKNTNVMKRKARVVENFLNVDVSGGDNLQKITDVLKIEVMETNALCEEDYQKKVDIRKELEALQKKQRDVTLQFKEDSDKLIF